MLDSNSEVSFEFETPQKTTKTYPNAFSSQIKEQNQQIDSNSLIIQINFLTKQIEALSNKNVELRKEHKQVEHDVIVKTSALNNVIDGFKKSNTDLEKQNAILNETVQAQQDLINQIIPVFKALLKKREDLQSVQGLDYEYLVDLIGYTGDEQSAQNEKDKYIEKIILKNEYFKDCRSNEDFIMKYKELRDKAMQKLKEDEETNDYKRLLVQLQNKNISTHTKLKAEINQLINEREKLKKQIDLKYRKRAF